MSTKKIYLIRHGQTDFNRMGIVQGSGVDADLNDLGRAQADAFYRTYRTIPFNKIYTSVLRRSIQSVERFIEEGIPHEALSGLNEISWGKKEGIRVTEEEDRYYFNILSRWRQGETSLAIEGGESPEDVIRRMAPAIDHILNQVEETTVLVCMHGRAMRIFLCYLMNLTLNAMDDFEHTNLGLYVIEVDDEKRVIRQQNDVAHLSLLM